MSSSLGHPAHHPLPETCRQPAAINFPHGGMVVVADPHGQRVIRCRTHKPGVSRTIGGAGFAGYIHAIEGDMVWLEIAENVEIRVVKAAISRKVTAPDASAMPPADEETDGGTAPTA